jgi:hypothetical protein
MRTWRPVAEAALVVAVFMISIAVLMFANAEVLHDYE